MRRSLFLYFLMPFFSLLSQGYYPFPDSNAVWSVNLDKYLVKGDSVFNSNTYKKYYVTSDTSLSLASLQYIGMVRQDIVNKKIFGLYVGSVTERIIFDFSLAINDTITVYPIGACGGQSRKIRISGKDSIMIGGNYRPRFFLSGYSIFIKDTVIEGIGSYCGPLGIGAYPYCATDVCPPKLLCEKENGILMFQTPFYNSCYYMTCPLNVMQIEKPVLSIYPNPASNRITLQSQKEIGSLTICNFVGETVLQSQIKTQKSEVDISSFPKGIYILQAQRRNYKLIKE